jgi:predicted NAD/FAD-dependent oxidoreductase
MRIAVIGAGLAGLTAARRLADAGHDVTVFDKSRGTGGRLATRRTDAGGIDHGAPWVTADGPFAEALDTLAVAGAAVREGRRYVGLPGMSGLVRPLAAALEVRTGCEVTALDAEAGTVAAGGSTEGAFDRTILAIPAPQARRLTGETRLDAVVMRPVWTLLAAFERRLDLPDEVRPEVAPVELALRDGAKPGREGETWVLHMRPDWSEANLERTREEMAPELAGLLGELSGESLPEPVYVAAHRWRFARTEVPLGRPFLAAAGGRLLIGGDWALGPDAAHAWESGRAMADALLG